VKARPAGSEATASAAGWLRIGALAAAAAAVSAQAPVLAAALPSFEAVRAAHRPSDIAVLDRHGRPVHWQRVDTLQRRGPWLALDEVSPALRQALVLSEDRRFWDHGGVDWPALAAGAWARAWNQRSRGASTLSMQLAAQLDHELARPAGGRSLGQKWSQLRRAQELEGRWSKAQILEAYLNRVPLRGELLGVAAAALQLFGKHASGLDAREAALLAAMVRAPNAGSALIERRACALVQAQGGDCGGLAIALAQALARRPGGAGLGADESIAPHFARHVLQRLPAGGTAQAQVGTTLDARTRVRTTLDARVQRLAWSALRRQVAELRGREVEDGAVLVLDNASGEVRAWVGSSGPGSQAAAVDAVLARRQPGSTLKPFVYALAFQARWLTAASRLDDAPLQLNAGIGSVAALYQPRNYDGGYKGEVSARQALASSLNVPAVRVGAMLDTEALFDGLNAVGLQLRESAGWHGHALALGSAEVTLLDLANAYRTLARGGLWSPVRWQPAMADAMPSRRVFEPAVAHLVGDILADPVARGIGFGMDSPLVTRGWAAVKTGTSKDLRDNWCVGYSSRYTVAVWVGNASGAPMHGVSGVSGAAPVWREVMAALHADTPSRPPLPPAGLQQQQGDWFLAGTAPRPAAAGATSAPRFGIGSPADGSLIVLDPDIPARSQRLLFSGAQGQWWLNGRALAARRGAARVSWLPRPGRHVLELRADDGGVLDRVRFEVRAAPAAPRAARALSPASG
jgi:penicillin-binding protein 1C